MTRWHHTHFSQPAARLKIGALAALAAALVLASTVGALGSPASGAGGRRLRERRIRRIALREARLAGDRHPLLIEHVSATLAQAQRATSGGHAIIPEGRMSAAPVYLVVIRGRFVLSHASPPRGARLPHGSVLTLTILARSGFITGRGLSGKMPELYGLGKLTVDLRARSAIPARVRALLLADARSAASRHGERKPHDIRAVRSTVRRARRLEDRTRPGRERPSGGQRPAYLIAMKGRFTFTCDGAAGASHTRAHCLRPHVLMLIVSARGNRVLACAGWGERYPDLHAAGRPVHLRRSARSAAGRR